MPKPKPCGIVAHGAMPRQVKLKYFCPFGLQAGWVPVPAVSQRRNRRAKIAKPTLKHETPFVAGGSELGLVCLQQVLL